MDRQAIFDRVATHLLTQGRKSLRDNRCMYRGDDGTACAIGCLIPDEKYSTRFEGLTPNSDPESFVTKLDRKSALLQFKETLADVAGATTESDYEFLRSLQTIHDFNYPERWQSELISFAAIHGLDYSGVE
jgi:hypothetical protein